MRPVPGWLRCVPAVMVLIALLYAEGRSEFMSAYPVLPVPAGWWRVSYSAHPAILLLLVPAAAASLPLLVTRRRRLASWAVLLMQLLWSAPIFGIAWECARKATLGRSDEGYHALAVIFCTALYALTALAAALWVAATSEEAS